MDEQEFRDDTIRKLAHLQTSIRGARDACILTKSKLCLASLDLMQVARWRLELGQPSLAADTIKTAMALAEQASHADAVITIYGHQLDEVLRWHERLEEKT